MVSSELSLIRQIVGVLGNIIGICLFLSPTPTFVRIVRKKSVERYSPIPYLATLINSLARLLYGLPIVHPHSTLIITISGIGIATAIVFLTIFFLFCGQRKRLVISAVLVVEAVFVSILTVLVLTLQHTTDERTLSVGIICCVFNAMMYVAPLSVMKLVIKTKSVEFMPFWLSLAGFLNASVWTTYGFVPFDPYMAIPNGIGCVLALAQLILYGIYYKSTSRIMAERQKQPGDVGEVGLPSTTAEIEPEKIVNFIQRVNGV